MTPDKASILAELDRSWDEVRSLVESLSDRELEEPGAVEEWSVKDLLGHMAFWAEKAAGDLEKLAAGRPEDIETPDSVESTDQWNAREAERRRGMSLEHIRKEWMDSFEAARKALEKIPIELLDTEVKGWSMYRRFGGDTFGHCKEHAADIKRWLQETETTEE